MSAISFDLKNLSLALVTQQKPNLSPKDILIRVAYSGVCGTDIHITDGSFPCKDGQLILGHEFSGIVEAIGSEVSGILPGDRVVADPNNQCYVCEYCTSGRYHLCKKEYEKSNLGVFRNGGWATYCTVPSAQVFKLPDSITLEQGALCEPLSCLAHGWDRISPVKIGQTILIQGAGIIGNLWAAVLHLQGHKRVTVSEPLEARRNLFQNLETGYRCVAPQELGNYQADLIIDCSGAAPAIEKALDLLAPGGKLCVFGVASPKARVSLSPYELYKKESTIIAVNVNPFSFPNALGLLEAMGDRYLNFNRLGIKTYKLCEFQSALMALKTGKIAKAMFEINKNC